MRLSPLAPQMFARDTLITVFYSTRQHASTQLWLVERWTIGVRPALGGVLGAALCAASLDSKHEPRLRHQPLPPSPDYLDKF